MKLLKLLSSSLVLIAVCSTASKAQSSLNLPSYLEPRVDSIKVKQPGSGILNLTPFYYTKTDSLQSSLQDSIKFNKKPKYSALNAPVSIPNAFKPQQQIAPAPMPILKIMLKKED